MHRITTTVMSSFIILLGLISVSFAQTDEIMPNAIAEVELYVKIVVATITGLAAILGLPMIYMTYRKTSVEIRKLELEANQLETASPVLSETSKFSDKGIQVEVNKSPNTNVHVLADPRFLAPLLILLDFIFAWILLTLASYFLRIFSLGDLGVLGLLILALFLLVPLAHQVMRVRHLMQPSSTLNGNPLTKQVWIVAHIIYVLAALTTFGFGFLLLYLDWSGTGNVTVVGRYFGFGLLILGLIATVLAPWIRKKLSDYISSFSNTE